MIYDESKKLTMYNRLKESFLGKENTIAFSYFDKNITRGQMLDEIEKLAYGFYKNGVRKGDKVAFCAVSSFELTCSIYALNKLGAIPCAMYPIAPINEMKYCLELLNPKFVLATKARTICERLNKANEGLNYKIIPLNPADSLPTFSKMMLNLNDYYDQKKNGSYINNNYLNWKDFCKDMGETAVQEGNIALMHPTGGTTGGKPKYVMISNENVEGLLRNFEKEGIVFNQNDVCLNVLVPFVAYGSANLHKSLVEGTKIILVPVFKGESLPKYFKKYKDITLFSGVPKYFEFLENGNFDFSKMKMFAAGGDAMSKEDNERVNSFLRQHGCEKKLLLGLGMTENFTTITTNTDKNCEVGTEGVSLGDNIVTIVKPGTTEEVPDGEYGEITVSGPSVTMGYYKNEEETAKVYVKHPDGKTYIHTGDIGHFDPDHVSADGRKYLFFDGRYKDQISRSGYKVYPNDVEEEIMTNEAVYKCSVVSTPDKTDNHAPKAHVILKDTYRGQEDKIFEQIIQSYDASSLSSFEACHCQVAIKFRDSFPLTKVQKVNKLALQIEDIISSYPDVYNCNISLQSNGEYLAEIVLKDDFNGDLDEIKSYCEKTMNIEKIPKQIIIYKYTYEQKIDKNKLNSKTIKLKKM